MEPICLNSSCKMVFGSTLENVNVALGSWGCGRGPFLLLVEILFEGERRFQKILSAYPLEKSSYFADDQLLPRAFSVPKRILSREVLSPGSLCCTAEILHNQFQSSLLPRPSDSNNTPFHIWYLCVLNLQASQATLHAAFPSSSPQPVSPVSLLSWLSPKLFKHPFCS